MRQWYVCHLHHVPWIMNGHTTHYSNTSWCQSATGALDTSKGKGKGFPYCIPSMGPELIPVYRQSACRWPLSHSQGSRLPLLSARPAVTSPATEHHHPLAGTKLYCLVTEAHRCEQLAQGCYAALPRAGSEPATYWPQVQCSTRCTTVYNWFLL